MSLFSDSDILVSADLAQIESEISAVAIAESILIAGTGGIIRQTWIEAKNEILRAQQLYNTWYGASSLAGSGSWAVLSSSYTAASIARVKPTQIVVSSAYAADDSAIKTWLSYAALCNFYRAAANRKVKDRYDLKFTRYKAEAGRMWGTLRANGLPIVFRPLECPGALHAVNAGIWAAANVSGVAGGAGGAASFDVAITYVDQSQYVSPASNGNGESGPSTTITYALAAAHFISVSIAGLNPPNGTPDQVGIADGQVVPLNASGWNLYAAPTGGTLTLQNVAGPIPIATKSYTLAGAVTTTGAALGTGQWPDRNLFFQRTLNRA
jgi:hypothetical protein